MQTARVTAKWIGATEAQMKAVCLQWQPCQTHPSGDSRRERAVVVTDSKPGLDSRDIQLWAKHTFENDRGHYNRQLQNKYRTSIFSHVSTMNKVILFSFVAIGKWTGKDYIAMVFMILSQ